MITLIYGASVFRAHSVKLINRVQINRNLIKA